MVSFAFIFAVVTFCLFLLLTRDSSSEMLSPETLLEVKSAKKSENIIHRTLLWDKKFPIRLRWVIREFRKKNSDLVQYLWRESDFLRLLDRYPQYRDVYRGYTKRIQKADFARYLILYHCGGTYLDLDIKPERKCYTRLLNKHQNHQALFVEEGTWHGGENDFTQDYPIRQSLDACQRKEAALRVANYLIFAKPGALIIKRILDKCVERSGLKIVEPYDVIFTTGPDVVSSVVAERQDDSFVVIPKGEADAYFRHLTTHLWHREI